MMGFTQAAYDAGYKAGKSKKKGLIIAIVAAVIIIPVIIIMIVSSQPKEFSCQELRIKLSSGYKEPDPTLRLKISTSSVLSDKPEYILVDSGDTAYFYRDEKGSYSNLEQYAQDTKNGFKGAESASLYKKGDYYYFVSDGKMIGSDSSAKSVVAMFESKNAFWTIDIGGMANTFSEKKILGFMDTVTFKE